MRKRFVPLVMTLGLVAAVAPVLVQIPVRIAYNPSDSVPRGWYRIGPPEVPKIGSVVLAHLPVESAAFAAQRGYLPKGVPILKRVGAIAPQSMCVGDGVVRIDGVVVATVRQQDGLQRPLQSWSPCRRLRDGELFLLSRTNPASFDSRYFGPIHAAAVIGNAHPLWTW